MKKRYKSGYWYYIGNIKYETFQIIKKFGSIPPSSFLSKNGHTSYVNAVSSYYGGFNKLRNDFNTKELQHKKNYFKDVKNIITELDLIATELGYYPSSKILRNLGYTSIESAIQRHHGGITNFYNKYNIPLDNIQRKCNFLSNWINLEKCLTQIFENIGHFPTDSELIYLKKFDVRNAMHIFGGINECRKRMGHCRSIIIANDGHACDSFCEKIVDDELIKRNIIHLRQITLTFNGKRTIPDFIINKNIIVEVLMVNPAEKSEDKVHKSYILRFNAKKQLYKQNKYILFEFYPEHFSSQESFGSRFKELYELVTATPSLKISTNCRYINELKKPLNYWTNKSNLDRELYSLCSTLNNFPCYTEIISVLGSGAYKSIRRHYGSIELTAYNFGYSLDSFKRKPRNFWKSSLQYSIKVLNEIYGDLGKFPSSNFLRDNYSSLYYAIITYYGGINNIRQIYSESYPLEKCVEPTFPTKFTLKNSQQ